MSSPTRLRRTSPSASSAEEEETLRALEYSEGPASLRTNETAMLRTPTSSLFEFNNNMIPLSLSQDADAEKEVGVENQKTVNFVNGVALVVGLQIGSGIFSSPGVVVADSGSVGASLLVWLAGGILAWTGANSFAELGSAIPVNGGAQAYLAYAYHPIVSFLYSWTAISALKPGGNAIIALIFGEYVNRLIYHANTIDDIPQWAIKGLACVAIAIVSVFCVASPKLATRLAVVFTTLKVLILASVPILGLVQLVRGKTSTSFREPLFVGSSTNPSSYALALFSSLWAYDGWDQVNYVAGEMKNPGKTIPKVINFSMVAVTTLFLLANASYFIVLDKATVGSSNTVALDLGRTLFGEIGATIFTSLVSLSCFGALNGAFFTSARLIYSASKEGFLPALFSQLHKTRKTPVNAMILQFVLTAVFIIVGGGFRSLVNFYSVANWGFYFLTVLGLVVLRVREPHLERPYRTFITTPLIFCAVALFLLSMPVLAAPLEALAAVGFIFAGVPIYFITHEAPGGVFGKFKDWLGSKGVLSHERYGTSRGGWTRVATEGDEHDEEVEMRTTTR